MALITDGRGREEELSGVAELEKAFNLPFAVVAALANRKLFPEPVHMSPPLWKSRDVERWRKRASEEREKDWRRGIIVRRQKIVRKTRVGENAVPGRRKSAELLTIPLPLRR